MRKNKKFVTVMVGLIIVVLLFSVIAIVAMYTSPQPTYQIPLDSITTTVSEPQDTIQGGTFVIGDENAVQQIDDVVEDENQDTTENSQQVIAEENVSDNNSDGQEENISE